jgi:predicted esterase
MLNRGITFAWCALLIVILLTSCASGPLAPTLVPVQASFGQELLPGVSESAAISLAGKWRAQKVDAFNDQLVAPDFDDSKWTEVNVPDSWAKQGFGDLEGTPKMVVYRTKVDVPRSWKGQAVGISAWFNPFNGRVFVNGTPVEPTRKPFAAYADISSLLKYGQGNTIAVTTMYEGYSEFAQAGQPRIGLIDQIPVTAMGHEEIEIAGNKATYIHPNQTDAYPVIVFNSTGSHFMAEREPWYDMGDELARQGISSLALALGDQQVESVQAAVEYLRQSEFVDPQRIFLLGGGQGAPTMLEAARKDPAIAGLIVLSAPPLKDLGQLGSRPVLLVASQGEQHGLILEQAQQSAAGVTKAKVVVLPGEGGGTFVFSTVWSQIRQVLMDFVKPAK